MNNDPREDQARLTMILRREVSPAVLSAILATPREVFVEPHFQAQSWVDSALPIRCGQTISQPSVVARMTEALNLTNRCKVLEIGTGSGYQAAVLARLARRVFSIERHPDLARIARERLQMLGLHNVITRLGDGGLGWPEQAPFDRIIITAAAEDVPPLLLNQLREGGVMVLPIGEDGGEQVLLRVEKTSDGLRYDELGPVKFVPLLSGVAANI